MLQLGKKKCYLIGDVISKNAPIRWRLARCSAQHIMPLKIDNPENKGKAAGRYAHTRAYFSLSPLLLCWLAIALV